VGGDAKEEQFVVQGFHSIISVCTLPPWTPSLVVDLMIKVFAKILREDLITLKTSVEASGGFSRNCSGSTGSDTLSINSTDSYKAVSQDISGSFQTKINPCILHIPPLFWADCHLLFFAYKTPGQASLFSRYS
jgi:hypothetical protein